VRTVVGAWHQRNGSGLDPSSSRTSRSQRGQSPSSFTHRRSTRASPARWSWLS